MSEQTVRLLKYDGPHVEGGEFCPLCEAREASRRIDGLESLRCDRTARNVDEWLDGILKRLDALESSRSRPATESEDCPPDAHGSTSEFDACPKCSYKGRTAAGADPAPFPPELVEAVARAIQDDHRRMFGVEHQVSMGEARPMAHAALTAARSMGWVREPEVTAADVLDVARALGDGAGPGVNKARRAFRHETTPDGRVFAGTMPDQPQPETSAAGPSASLRGAARILFSEADEVDASIVAPPPGQVAGTYPSPRSMCGDDAPPPAEQGEIGEELAHAECLRQYLLNQPNSGSNQGALMDLETLRTALRAAIRERDEARKERDTWRVRAGGHLTACDALHLALKQAESQRDEARRRIAEVEKIANSGLVNASPAQQRLATDIIEAAKGQT